MRWKRKRNWMTMKYTQFVGIAIKIRQTSNKDILCVGRWRERCCTFSGRIGLIILWLLSMPHIIFFKWLSFCSSPLGLFFIFFFKKLLKLSLYIAVSTWDNSILKLHPIRRIVIVNDNDLFVSLDSNWKCFIIIFIWFREDLHISKRNDTPEKIFINYISWQC